MTQVYAERWPLNTSSYYYSLVLWCCWLGGRKGIRRVNWVVRYWRGCLSGKRCKWFVCGPANATATPSYLASLKSRMAYLSGAGLPRLYWKVDR